MRRKIVTVMPVTAVLAVGLFARRTLHPVASRRPDDFRQHDVDSEEAAAAGFEEELRKAGAGKTEAISRRVVDLVEGCAEPGQIIAFTFTERAAASLYDRITRRIAESKGKDYLDRLSPMYIGTIREILYR